MPRTATRSISALVGKANKAKMEADKVSGDSWRPGLGKNYIWIMPPPADSDVFYVDANEHYFQEKSYTCNRMKGAKCFFCNQANKLEDDEAKKQLRARRKVACWVFDKAHPERGLQVWKPSRKLWGEIIEIIQAEEDWGDILDPLEGRPFNIVKAGAGLTTTYQPAATGKVQPWPDSLIGIIEEAGGIPDISIAVQFDLDYAAQKAIWLANEDEDDDDDDDDDDDEDNTPVRRPRSLGSASAVTAQLNGLRKGAAAKGKAKVAVVDDSDEDDVDEDSEDLEGDLEEDLKATPAKARRASTRRPAPVDEDEEDDDDEEEEDDEPAPAPRGRRAAAPVEDDEDEDDEEEEDDDEPVAAPAPRNRRATSTSSRSGLRERMAAKATK